MTSLRLDPGTTFAGRYRIERLIPGGGMSAVYEVLHIETQRRRALKVMLPDLVQDAGLRARFRDEASVTAAIDSEFIVDVLDAGVDVETGLPFLVMELLRGEELGTRIRRLGPMPRADVLCYLRQVASALDKTHAASIVHRDLKPENLFLTFREDGSPRVKILDFGIAKVVRDGTAHNRRGYTAVLGTPLYMAPEQFLGQEPSPATDIQALGLIAYTLLVGRPYWCDEYEAAGHPIAFALKASNGPVESPTRRAARASRGLPSGFDDWFFRAAHRLREKRFERASVAVAALADLDTRAAPLPEATLGELSEGSRSSDVAAAPGTPSDSCSSAGEHASSLRPAVATHRVARRASWTPWLAGSAAIAALLGLMSIWMQQAPGLLGSLASEAPPSSNGAEPAVQPLVVPADPMVSVPPPGPAPVEPSTESADSAQKPAADPATPPHVSPIATPKPATRATPTPVPPKPPKPHRQVPAEAPGTPPQPEGRDDVYPYP